MRLLITGGLGYIGGRVAAYCKKENPELEIILTTRKKRKYFPKWTTGFRVSRLELLDERSITECIAGSDPDCIIHLAAVNEIDSEADPDLAREVNFHGTEKLLRAASIKNVKKFIYFSTFHVYGAHNGRVITEESSVHPKHPYSVTHLAAEKAVKTFNGNGMKTLIFRLSNSYGYPMDEFINRWTLVVNDLCRQAVVTGRIVLKSSGRQYRDFIALHDVARAVYHFVETDIETNELYNLGGESSMTIREMASAVAETYEKQYGKKIKDFCIGKDTGKDPKEVIYNIEKLKNTGFILKGNMVNEIEKTLTLCESFVK
ncbi:MAG: SDR family oxidoreductase [Candidatus Omnitrophota bacterium]